MTASNEFRLEINDCKNCVDEDCPEDDKELVDDDMFEKVEGADAAEASEAIVIEAEAE